MDYDNELRGVLFKNNKKESEKYPDYTGTVTVEGVEYRLAAWIRESKQGNKFMSLSLTPPEDMSKYDAKEPVQHDEENLPF